MRDPWITEIEWLTRGVRAIRIARFGEREQDMALEIKGLKGKALKARANIDALNGAYDKFNEAAPAHVSDVESLTSQVTGMQDDLEFAANVLGNSTERLDGSETTAQKRSPPPASEQAPVQTNAPVSPPASPPPMPQPGTVATPAISTPIATGDQRSFDRLG